MHSHAGLHLTRRQQHVILAVVILFSSYHLQLQVEIKRERPEKRYENDDDRPLEKDFLLPLPFQPSAAMEEAVATMFLHTLLQSSSSTYEARQGRVEKVKKKRWNEKEEKRVSAKKKREEGAVFLRGYSRRVHHRFLDYASFRIVAFGSKWLRLTIGSGKSVKKNKENGLAYILCVHAIFTF